VALRWTLAAFADLRRIHEFLEPVSPTAAAQAVRLVSVRGYEIRYEVSGTNLVVLRVFHAREDP